jgi:adenylyltransferase/sulfurtransferase
MKLTNYDLRKFSKQIVLKKIGLNGQKKIFKSKVLIIGAGGLGCPLLLYLASSGVGTIGIVDNDKIELSNLNRQILFNSKDIGKYKVAIAKKKILGINKKIKLKIFNCKINIKNINQIIKNFDIICDGTDNYKSRYLINDTCRKMKKILISSAISGFDGHLFNFNFKKKIPCFRCFTPEIPNIENNCGSEGVITTLAGIMGTLQAQEVLNSILNISNNLVGKILIFNALKLDFRKVKLSINPRCVNKCSKKF